jgi:hypothetical protein
LSTPLLSSYQYAVPNAETSGYLLATLNTQTSEITLRKSLGSYGHEEEFQVLARRKEMYVYTGREKLTERFGIQQGFWRFHAHESIRVDFRVYKEKKLH